MPVTRCRRPPCGAPSSQLPSISRAYGMTEFGHVDRHRRDDAAGAVCRQRRSRSRRSRSVSGTRTARRWRGARGRILTRGPFVFAGYLAPDGRGRGSPRPRGILPTPETGAARRGRVPSRHGTREDIIVEAPRPSRRPLGGSHARALRRAARRGRRRTRRAIRAGRGPHRVRGAALGRPPHAPEIEGLLTRHASPRFWPVGLAHLRRVAARPHRERSTAGGPGALAVARFSDGARPGTARSRWPPECDPAGILAQYRSSSMHPARAARCVGVPASATLRTPGSGCWTFGLRSGDSARAIAGGLGRAGRAYTPASIPTSRPVERARHILDALPRDRIHGGIGRRAPCRSTSTRIRLRSI